MEYLQKEMKHRRGVEEVKGFLHYIAFLLDVSLIIMCNELKKVAEAGGDESGRSWVEESGWS